LAGHGHGTGLKTRRYNGRVKRTGLKTRRYKNRSIADSRLHPGDGLGAGKRVQGWIWAEFFSDGILPDVGGGSFDRFVCAKNVVVIARFPKCAMVGFAEIEGRALLEKTNEFAEIRGISKSFRQDVQMVGHGASGVEFEGVPASACEEYLKDAGCDARCGEMPVAEGANDSYGTDLAAEVVLGQ
jgi:hypothetical protein